jgi:hypothetical protein
VRVLVRATDHEDRCPYPILQHQESIESTNKNLGIVSFVERPAMTLQGAVTVYGIG